MTFVVLCYEFVGDVSVGDSSAIGCVVRLEVFRWGFLWGGFLWLRCAFGLSVCVLNLCLRVSLCLRVCGFFIVRVLFFCWIVVGCRLDFLVGRRGLSFVLLWFCFGCLVLGWFVVCVDWFLLMQWFGVVSDCGIWGLGGCFSFETFGCFSGCCLILVEC